MRLLHCADLHLGRPERYGPPETKRILDLLVHAAISRSVDMVALAGDTLNGRTNSPAALDLLAGAMRDLSEAGIYTVIGSGNHDGPAVVANADTHTLAWARSVQIPGVAVVLEPRIVECPEGTAFVLPYPHRRAYDQHVGDLPPEERMAQIAKDVGLIIETNLATMRAGKMPRPWMFIGHLTVAGALVGSERAMRLEDDVSVSADVFAGYDYVALGHIHRQQQVAPNAWYAGSPDYIDFGEAGQRKGFLLVETTKPGDLTVEVIPTTAREMVTIDLTDPSDLGRDIPVGAIVRVRLALPTTSTEGLRRVIRQTYLEAGASHVQVEFVVPERQATERAITAAVTDTEALTAYLRSRDLPDEPYVAAAAALMEDSRG